jgi:DNA-binding MarR family transcriptional regulator
MYKNSLTHSIIQVCRAHRYLLRRALGKTGLHRGQPPVLFALHQNDGLTHSELAQKLEVSPATITNMIRRMEDSGFVVRCRDGTDQRISRVYLTEAGKNIFSELEAVMNDIEAKLISGVGQEEQDTLRRLLDKIHDNLIQSVAQGTKNK